MCACVYVREREGRDCRVLEGEGVGKVLDEAHRGEGVGAPTREVGALAASTTIAWRTRTRRSAEARSAARVTYSSHSRFHAKNSSFESREKKPSTSKERACEETERRRNREGKRKDRKQAAARTQNEVSSRGEQPRRSAVTLVSGWGGGL